tara:strand:+ start:1828 stop:2136 length:309 start_codon:yes stop_codon:yes gene_type:complete
MNPEYKIRKILNIENNSIEIFIIIGKNIYYENDNEYPQIEKAYFNIKQANEYLQKYDEVYSKNDINLYIEKIEIAIKITGELYIVSRNNFVYTLSDILSILK